MSNVIVIPHEEAAITAADVFLIAHPVGSLYETINDEESTPELMAEKYGGTWNWFGQGRVTVGVDSAIEIFDSPEKEFGIRDAIVPYHRHSFTRGNATSGSTSSLWYQGLSSTGTLNTAYAGTAGNEVDANIQPSIAVFRYIRLE